MSLSREEISKVALLARLSLDEEEVSALALELTAIVDYVAQLQQIDTKGVEPLAHPLPVKNVFREDAPGQSLAAEDALVNAPEREKNLFSVPAVFD